MQIFKTCPNHGFDVVVVGDGITGLSTVYHLVKMGVDNIAWSMPQSRFCTANSGTSSRWKYHDILYSVPAEYLTRLTHRYGPKLGIDFWLLNQNSYTDLLESFVCQNVTHHSSAIYSLSLSEHETVEQKKCLHEFKTRTHSSSSHELFHIERLSSQKHLGFLNAALCSPLMRTTWFSTQEFREAFSKPLEKVVRIPPVLKINSTVEGLDLSLSESEDPVQTQMIVLACHLGISELLPAFEEALVPITEQMDVFEYSADSRFHNTFAARQLDLFRMNYGQTWFQMRPDRKILIGGSRFLRPLQGVGMPGDGVSSKITMFHKDMLSKIFVKSSLKHLSSQTYVDLLPCDETPLVGQLPGEPRILMATGFYGFGMCLAFQSGQWLARIIATGKEPSLPRVLSPERLRTLAEAR